MAETRKSSRIACFSHSWTTTSPSEPDLGDPGLALVEQVDRLVDVGGRLGIPGLQLGPPVPQCADGCLQVGHYEPCGTGRDCNLAAWALFKRLGLRVGAASSAGFVSGEGSGRGRPGSPCRIRSQTPRRSATSSSRSMGWTMAMRTYPAPGRPVEVARRDQAPPSPASRSVKAQASPPGAGAQR